MTIDPLSAATRTAKRNLLAVSIAAITYKAFNVTVEDFPIAGFRVHFEKGAFAFLLISTILYFTITFILYYWIDIRNLEKAPHLAAAEEAYRIRVSSTRYRSLQAIKQKVDSSAPKNVSVRIDDGVALRLLERSEKFWRPIKREDLMSQTELMEIREPVGRRVLRMHSDLDQEVSPFYGPAVEVLWARMRRHGPRMYASKLALSFWLWSVRLVYLVRNYGTDGLFPIALAAFAVFSFYDVLPTQWLTHLLPPSAR